MEMKSKVVLGSLAVAVLIGASFYLQGRDAFAPDEPETSSSQQQLSLYTPQSLEEETTSSTTESESDVSSDLQMFNAEFVRAFNEYDSLVERSELLESYMISDLYEYYRITNSAEVEEVSSQVEINTIYEDIQSKAEYLNDITVTVDNVKKNMIFRVKYISLDGVNLVSEVEFLSVKDAILD